MQNSKLFDRVTMVSCNISRRLAEDLEDNFKMFLEEWEAWYETLIQLEGDSIRGYDSDISKFRKFMKKLKNWSDIFATVRWELNERMLIYCCKKLKHLFVKFTFDLEDFERVWLSCYDSEEECDRMDLEKEDNMDDTDDEEEIFQKLSKKYPNLDKKKKQIVKTINTILRIRNYLW